MIHAFDAGQVRNNKFVCQNVCWQCTEAGRFRRRRQKDPFRNLWWNPQGMVAHRFAGEIQTSKYVCMTLASEVT